MEDDGSAIHVLPPVFGNSGGSGEGAVDLNEVFADCFLMSEFNLPSGEPNSAVSSKTPPSARDASGADPASSDGQLSLGGTGADNSSMDQRLFEDSVTSVGLPVLTDDLGKHFHRFAQETGETGKNGNIPTLDQNQTHNRASQNLSGELGVSAQRKNLVPSISGSVPWKSSKRFSVFANKCNRY